MSHKNIIKILLAIVGVFLWCEFSFGQGCSRVGWCPQPGQKCDPNADIWCTECGGIYYCCSCPSGIVVCYGAEARCGEWSPPPPCNQPCGGCFECNLGCVQKVGKSEGKIFVFQKNLREDEKEKLYFLTNALYSSKSSMKKEYSSKSSMEKEFGIFRFFTKIKNFILVSFERLIEKVKIGRVFHYLGIP